MDVANLDQEIRRNQLIIDSHLKGQASVNRRALDFLSKIGAESFHPAPKETKNPDQVSLGIQSIQLK
jgi:hypothetical protein